MRTLLIPGLAAAMALTGGVAPAFAQNSRAKTSPGTSVIRTAPRWGQRTQGRWTGGVRAPGGYVAYRRPVRGFALPRYWIQPSFYIGNYATYGLPTPPSGYGWSRYYDDAVMTDAYGRVIDSRSGIRWEEYEGGYAEDQPEFAERRDNGLGGAAIGAVAGGVAGNVIAGKGNRTVGTVVGAAAGALAGAAIDKAEDRPPRDDRHRADNDGWQGDWEQGPEHDRGPPPPHHVERHHRGVTYDTAYDGRWTGTWTREDGSTYSGEYEGRFEGDVEGSYTPPHWGPGGYGSGGYISGGYYYPAPTVTTITIQPAAPTYTETVSYVTVRQPRRPARHRAKCAC